MNRIIWALFGNDEDGPIGNARWNPSRTDTWLVRVRWWLRNPFHNLFFHVIGFPMLGVLAWPAQPEVSGVWPQTGRVMLAWVWGARWWQFGPFVSWRAFRIEGYCGWRPGTRAHFGMALRVAHAR